MKLAAIVSLFDGEELLKGAIQQIREHVDEVIIVYQQESWYGNYHIGGREKAFELLRQGIATEIIYIETSNNGSATGNECWKRKHGVEIARKKECTHFMFLDADEYYNNEQFKKAKDLIESGGFDSSACRLYTYYKYPTWQISPMEEYYVPFIHKISIDTQIGTHSGYPVYADPTRSAGPCLSFKKFEIDDLAMHHFSYVRSDISLKLNNSSAKQNFKNIPDLIAKFASYQLGEQPPNFDGHTTIEAPNQFNIEI